MEKIARLVTVAMFLSFGSPVSFSQSHADLIAIASDEFEAKNFRGLLRLWFTQLGIENQIYLGDGIRSNKINLKVIKESVIKDRKLELLKMNAIAVQPNVILLSEYFLTLIVLESLNSALEDLNVQALASGDPDADAIMHQKISAIRRIHRLRNLRRGYTTDETSLINIMKPFIDGDHGSDSRAALIFAGAFSQVIFHEIAHLRNGELNLDSSNGLFKLVEDWITKSRALKILEEEKRADQASAINVIKVFLKIHDKDLERGRLFPGWH